MKVLVIEDEMLAQKQIITYLKDMDASLEITGTIESVSEGLEWFNNHPMPDAIISDIKLNDGLSFEIFKDIHISAPIIFTTAYDQYAIQAFEHNSIGYLLKPIRKDKLKECFDKIKGSMSMNSIDLSKLAQMLTKPVPQYKSRFLVKVGQKIKAVSVDKIAYFFSHDKMTYLHTRSNEKFPLDQSLDEIQDLLNPNNFFRINRKFLVHFEGIKEVHPYFKGRLKVELLPAIDEDIVISAEKTPVFKSWLDK